MMNEPLIADRDFMEEGCVSEYVLGMYCTKVRVMAGGALVESTTFP